MSEKLFLDMLNECLKVDESKVDEVKINEGQFSWLTGDTDQPIYSTEGHQQPVWMLDDKGNQWEESNYEGYGVFGGKDFYELLAEMNGLGLDRDAGMDLAYKDNRTGENTPGVKYPRFVSDPKIKYEEVFNPMQHDNQGWFMEDDIDESKVNEKEEPEDIFMEPEEEDDLSPDPDDIEPKEEEAALEIEKEYLGKTEDTHFYILFSEDDIQILDQLGEKKYSAIDNNLDISDPNRFVVQAIQDVEIEQIERGIFMRYVLPLLLEEEPEEEQEEDLETAEGEEELEEIPSEKERPVESKKVVEKEMPTCKKCGKKHWPFEKCDKKDEKEEVDETEKVEEKSGGGTERNRYKLLFALPKNVKGKLIVKGQAASFKAFVEKHKDKLQGADLHGADLSGAELEGVDLRKADLSRADLSFADLSNGNLRFVNFLGANLGSANLSNTNMRAVRLSYAHLAAADLTGADLTGANLEGVDLSDANLEGVIGLEPGYVSRIKGQWADRKTKIDTMGKEVEESSDESSR